MSAMTDRIGKFSLAALGAFALAACASAPREAPAPQSEFFDAIAAHCGTAYEGRVVSTDAADKDFAAEKLVMEVRDCSNTELRIPFHVGADRSRTWVISKTPSGLRLKHDHRHEDGSDDAVTMYGGDTAGEGTPTRQEFPVDAYSIEMFNREGRSASVTNVWAVEIHPEMFAYELRRENRFFRVEFDLTEPAANPPAPWGAQ